MLLFELDLVKKVTQSVKSGTLTLIIFVIIINLKSVNII